MDVHLRRVVLADLPAFFEHQRDPAAVAMSDFPPRDRAAFDAHWAKLLKDDSNVVRTIVVDGETVGHVCRWEHDGRRLVGYVLARSHWGRGIATRALSAFLAELPERPLHAYVATHNAASKRVLEKCGFTVAAELDGEFLYVLGADAAHAMPR